MGLLEELAVQVLAAKGFDNAIDLKCEIALFQPNDGEVAIRLNDAGSKVIVTFEDGKERTFVARDYTISYAARLWTAEQLRARHALALSKGDAS